MARRYPVLCFLRSLDLNALSSILSSCTHAAAFLVPFVPQPSEDDRIVTRVAGSTLDPRQQHEDATHHQRIGLLVMDFLTCLDVYEQQISKLQVRK
ncbi:hypothetical protein Tco_0368370 [Tanacetum coccineum]